MFEMSHEKGRRLQTTEPRWIGKPKTKQQHLQAGTLQLSKA